MKVLVFVMCFVVVGFVNCVPAILGPCECGAFDKNDVTTTDTPIIETKPMNVTCDEDGQKACIKLCCALAQISNEKAPTMLCAAIGHAVDLTPSVFARTCDNTEWIYTGLTSTRRFCCHESESIECKE